MAQKSEPDLFEIFEPSVQLYRVHVHVFLSLSINLSAEFGCAVDAGPTYGTAKKKRPGYLVGNLVATNWPIEKALHAIGYNQIPTK